LNADSNFDISFEETDCKQRWPALFAHSASLDPPLSIIALQQATTPSHKALLKTRGMCKDRSCRLWTSFSALPSSNLLPKCPQVPEIQAAGTVMSCWSARAGFERSASLTARAFCFLFPPSSDAIRWLWSSGAATPSSKVLPFCVRFLAYALTAPGRHRALRALPAQRSFSPSADQSVCSSLTAARRRIPGGEAARDACTRSDCRCVTRTPCRHLSVITRGC
jgi:hypothetical protein